MSICAHGTSVVNRWRISAAAIIPPLRLAHVFMSATSDSIAIHFIFYQGMAQRLAAASSRPQSSRPTVGGGENRSHFITEARAGTSDVATSTIARIDFNGD